MYRWKLKSWVLLGYGSVCFDCTASSVIVSHLFQSGCGWHWIDFILSSLFFRVTFQLVFSWVFPRRSIVLSFSLLIPKKIGFCHQAGALFFFTASFNWKILAFCKPTQTSRFAFLLGSSWTQFIIWLSGWWKTVHFHFNRYQWIFYCRNPITVVWSFRLYGLLRKKKLLEETAILGRC